MDVTQIGYTGSLAKTSDIKTAAADLVSSANSALFSDFLSSGNNVTGTFDAKNYKSKNPADQKLDAYDRYQYKDNTVEPAQETSVSDKVDELSEETEKLASDVIAAVSEDLQVDEDDVVNAMETLGLTVFDLANPQNLAELVKTLTGTDDDTQILLNADFQQTLNDVSGLVEAFAGANGMDMQELSDFAEAYAAQQVSAEDVLPEVPDTSVEAQNRTPDQETLSVQADNLTSGQRQTDVTVEDRRDQTDENGEKDVETGAGETVNEEFSGARTEEKTAEKNESSSSGKQESQDFSQHLASAVNEQLAEVTDAENAAGIPEYASVDAQDIIDQIVEQTKVILKSDTTSIEMQLNPENLGKIFLNISSKEGAVSAQLFAQNDAVRAALETQIATLTENLNQAGVKVDAIEVSVAAHQFERNLEQNAKGDEEQGRRGEEKKSERRSLRMDSLDDLSGLMTEEEVLAARIMKDNGNSVDFTA
jgi:flagellar hook-length control protein FliK